MRSSKVFLKAANISWFCFYSSVRWRQMPVSLSSTLRFRFGRRFLKSWTLQWISWINSWFFLRRGWIPILLSLPKQARPWEETTVNGTNWMIGRRISSMDWTLQSGNILLSSLLETTMTESWWMVCFEMM